MEKKQGLPAEGLAEIEGSYEFANLSLAELDRIKEVERQLGRDGEKTTVLLAYERRDQ